MESGDGLHEDQSRLQALLRGGVRRTVPGRAWTPVRAGLRLEAVARTSGGAAPVEGAPDDLRQLDERPVPRAGAGRVHRERVPDDGARPAAHVPSPDEEGIAARRLAPRKPDLLGDTERLARRVRGGSPVRGATHRPPTVRSRRGSVPLSGAAARRPRSARPDRDRLGDRRRGEWERRTADAARVGALSSRAVHVRRDSVLLQAVGRAMEEANRPRVRRSDVGRDADPLGVTRSSRSRTFGAAKP